MEVEKNKDECKKYADQLCDKLENDELDVKIIIGYKFFLNIIIFCFVFF